MDLHNDCDTAVLEHPARGATSGRVPARRGDAIAQAVSHAASPPVLSVAAAVAVAAADGRPEAFLAAAAFGVIGVLLPLLILVYQWREGEIADLEITRRDQRLWPLLLTTTCVGAAGIALQLAGAPPPVAGVASILGVESLLLLAITTSWKISVHCAAAATAGALVAALTGLASLALLPVLPVIWSRLQLRRHTPLQCLAGTALGASLILLLWPMIGA